jgi:succinate dehydrogenase / fumarate reductase membrane anchor subunit
MDTMHAFKGSSNTGAMTWFFQRVTGLLLVVFLGGHFLFQHFFAEDPQAGQLTYESVGRTLANPMWKTLEMGFLLFALFHGINGVWMILADYVHWKWLRVGLFSVLSVGALVLLVLGAVTILPFTVAFR